MFTKLFSMAETEDEESNEDHTLANLELNEE